MRRLLNAVAVLVLGAQLCSGAFSNGSEIEDRLETEIIFVSPGSFAHRTKEYLVTRQGYPEKVTQYSKEGKLVSNSSLDRMQMSGRMAYHYWYETRKPYTNCEMEPGSFSTFFDWACMVPCMFGNPHIPPGTIYVNTLMLPHFVESTLKFMPSDARFVLVSGGDDLTIPRSTDERYRVLRGFARSNDGGKYFQTLLNDPRIIHWFAENHDLSHPKISTLPTGLTNEIHDQAVRSMPNTTNYFTNRTLQILVSDSLRPPNMPRLGETHEKHVSLLQSVPFIACVVGGGMDPSPSAWEAIMAGTIPIILHSTLDDAYRQLPVVFVESWNEIFKPESEEKLEGVLRRWMDELQPYYVVGSALRNQTLEKLKAKYWVKQVDKAYIDYFLHQGGSPIEEAPPSVASYWDVNRRFEKTNIGAQAEIVKPAPKAEIMSKPATKADTVSKAANKVEFVSKSATKKVEIVSRPPPKANTGTLYASTLNVNKVHRSAATQKLQRPVQARRNKNGH